MNKINETSKINFIFFLNNFFVNIKMKVNKPNDKKIELWIKPWGTKKLVIYDKIVINNMPLKPNSPIESLTDKIFDDSNPKPIIENKIKIYPK